MSIFAQFYFQSEQKMRLVVKIIYLFIFLMGISLCLEAQVRKIIIDKNKEKKDSIQKAVFARGLALRTALDSLKNTNLSTKRLQKERLGRLYALYTQEKQNAKSLIKTKKIVFKEADIVLSQQIGNRIGDFPIQIPPTQTRFSLRVKADLLGIPIVIDQFWTSAQTDIRQPMNRLSVNIDWLAYQTQLQKHFAQKINEIKNQINTDDLQKLEQLEKLQQDFPNTDNLKQDLAHYQQQYNEEKLKELALEKAKKEGNKNIDKIKKSEKGKIVGVVYQKTKEINANNANVLLENQKKILEDSLKKTATEKKEVLTATAEKKISPRKKKAIEKYLKTEKMTIEKLQKLNRWKDSLQRIQADVLQKYEVLKGLQNLKTGDLTSQAGALEQFGVFGQVNRWIKNIKQFQIGTTNPIYTPLTLQGIPLNGLHSAFEFNQWHFAVSGGQTLRANPTMRQFNRRIYAGSIGYGKKDKSHWHINFLRGEDDKLSFRGDSILTGLNDTTFYDKPRMGYVLSNDFRWQFKKFIDIKLEIGQSFVSLNTNVREISPANMFVLPVHSILPENGTNLSTQRGWAMMGEITSNLNESSQLSVKTRYIQPTYFSLGLPYLRNDIQGIEIQGRQLLWKKKITLQPTIAVWEDNVLQRNITTTHIQKIGINANFNFSKLPQMMIGYQSNVISRNNLLEKVNILQAQIQKSYKIGISENLSVFQYTYNSQPKQLTESQINNLGIFTNQWSFKQETNFNSNWKISVEIAHLREQNTLPRIANNSWSGQQGNFSYNIDNYVSNRWLNYKLGVQYTLFGIWQNKINGILGSQNLGGYRSGIQLQSGLQWDNFSFSMGYVYNDINTQNIFSYIEELGNISVGYRF